MTQLSQNLVLMAIPQEESWRIIMNIQLYIEVWSEVSNWWATSNHSWFRCRRHENLEFKSIYLNWYHSITQMSQMLWRAYVHNLDHIYLFTNRSVNMDVAWYIYKCLCLHPRNCCSFFKGRKSINWFSFPFLSPFIRHIFHYSIWRLHLFPRFGCWRLHKWMV